MTKHAVLERDDDVRVVAMIVFYKAEEKRTFDLTNGSQQTTINGVWATGSRCSSETKKQSNNNTKLTQEVENR